MQRLGHSQFLGCRDLEVAADPEVSGIPVWSGKTRRLAVPAVESARLWHFEPIFVDSQALDF